MDSLIKKCLVITNDDKLKRKLTQILNKSGTELTFLAETNSLYSILKKAFHLLILDANIAATLPIKSTPNLKCIAELIENIEIYSPALPIIVLSSKKDFELAKMLIKYKVFNLLTKPISKNRLLEVIQDAVQENIDRSNKIKLLKVAQHRPYDILLLKEIAESTAKSKLSINFLLEKIIDQIADLLHVEIVSIMMLDEKKKTLKMSASKGLSDERAKKAKLNLGEGVAGFVAKTKEPLLINNIGDTTIFSQSKWADSTYKTNSLLTVPIKLKDEVIGIINVNNKEDGSEFNESDKNIMTAISNQVAMAIENFKLYANLKVKADQLTKSNRKLQSLSKTKSELLCNLSHELKTPLTSVIGYLELLLNFSIGESETTKMGYLKVAHTESLKIAQLIERILNFFNLETNKIQWDMTEINLNDILTEIIKQIQPGMSKERIIFGYENKLKEIMIYADYNMLKKAFEHLFENAIKFNDSSRKITLKVEEFQETSANFVKLTLFNTGKKIKDEHIEKIFEGLYQPGNILTDKPRGVGLGLATVQGIFKKHKGYVKLDNTSENGNTFICVLPMVERRGLGEGLGTGLLPL